MSVGIHFHGLELRNQDGLVRLNPKWCLYLASNSPWQNDLKVLYPQVKALLPDHVPMVRHFHPDVMSMTPEDAAKQFCGLLDEVFGSTGVDAIPGPNEGDLPLEHGGKQCLNFSEGRAGWASDDGMAAIADWLSRYADAHRALRPQDTLHLPACSAGMDSGHYVAAMPWRKFGVIDFHAYDLTAAPRTNWEGKTVAVTEWGKIGGTPQEYADFARTLGNTPNALWKWSSPSGATDPSGYEIFDRPDVIDALASIEEETTMTSEDDLYHIWIAEYERAHSGKSPAEVEFRKHKLAIDANLTVTQADVDAVAEDVKSGLKQLELLRARLGGGSEPRPF